MDFSGIARPVTLSEGRVDAPIVIVSGVPSWEGTPLSEPCKNLLLDTARRAGIQGSDIRFECVLGEIPIARKEQTLNHDRVLFWQNAAQERLSRLKDASVFVPIGDLALSTLTEHTSTDKWQLSIIPGTKIGGRKTIPLQHPERVFASYKEFPFLSFGFQRIAEEMKSPLIKVTPRLFHTGPTFEQALKFLGRCMFADQLSCDIETAHGQITCIGFAMTSNEAMCIPTLPDNWPQSDFHKLWEWIRDVLESPVKKVFQNYIYDCTYLSRYGVSVCGLWHDTMHAQKFLHPELPKGLDTVARLYTREPYWKDEGKDWKNVGDLNQFWIYNCKDVCVTLEAALVQRKELESRNLIEPFERLVMSLSGPAAEMSWRGLPINLAKREEVKLETETEITSLESQLNVLAATVLGKPINSRSPKQIKEFFKLKKYRLPVKKGKETSDATALLKLQQRYPHDDSLRLLITLSEKNKMLSSYLKPMPYPDGRFRYSLDIHGTEPGRWSCRKDPWDNGINAQTISSLLKKMFVAPPGWLYFEADLMQADSRFVAWDAPEPTLIKFYTEGRDIHRFVASRPELFNKAESEITKDERQLGKKVGHASNYGMRGSRLSEICLLEMGISLSPQRADQMLEGYHRIFPGIRMWQARIAAEIRRNKRLSTPLGRERYFYDRLGDDLYRTAYAYRPPSTVSDIINCLIKHLAANRDPEKLHLILQAHDAAICLVREDYLDTALALVRQTDTWNPKLALAGGTLQIPTEIKAGANWGEAKAIL